MSETESLAVSLAEEALASPGTLLPPLAAVSDESPAVLAREESPTFPADSAQPFPTVSVARRRTVGGATVVTKPKRRKLNGSDVTMAQER